jgi:hypothetical protein
MSYENYTFDNQNIYLSGQFLQGVQAISTNFKYPEKEVFGAGYQGPVALSEEGEINGEFEITRVVTKDDPITGFFADGIDGYLNYGNQKAYVFETGIINRYSLNAEIGSIPTIETTFGMWGEVKTEFNYPPEAKDNTSIPIISNGDVEVILENCAGGHTFNVSTDLIESLSLDIDIDWKPITNLSSIRPAGFIAQQPTVVVCDISFQINEFKCPNFEQTVCAPVLKNIIINIKDCSINCTDPSKILRSFTIPQAQLVEYNQDSSMDSELVGHATFRSTTLNPSTLHRIFI